MVSLLSRAGCNKLQKEAATITPAAKPVNIFCKLFDICFEKKNTIAAPKLVPAKGINSPIVIAPTMYNPPIMQSSSLQPSFVR